MTESTKNLLSADGSAILLTNLSFERCHLSALTESLSWQAETIKMFGKLQPVPRLIAYYGCYPYTYSGVTHPAQPMSPLLKELCQVAQEHTDFGFNSVLCNQYRDGSDSMGYHRDNEKEMDTRCIASFSFGASRKFKFRHRETREVVDVELPGNSLLIMRDCQEQWEHGLPKTKRKTGARVNLTFRRMRDLGS